MTERATGSVADLTAPTPLRGRRPTSFRTRLIWSSTMVTLLCMSMAGVTLATIEVLAYRSQAMERAGTLAQVIAANSEAALSFDDAAAAEQVLTTLAKDPEIAQAALYRGEPPQIFAAFQRDASAPPLPPASVDDASAWAGWDRLSVAVAVRHQGQVIGTVQLLVELRQQRGLLQRLVSVFGILLLITLALAGLLAARLQRSITEPVTELLAVVKQVQQTKDFQLRSAVRGADELAELAQAFNAMLDEIGRQYSERMAAQSALTELNEQLEARVAQRTEELAHSNDDLVELLAKLKQTQSQLVESEKMAALGGLVAGVAHEINTPLGICVTVASHLENRVKVLETAAESGLKRSMLVQFFQECESALPMLQGNLQRAAHLVRSFKLVAVDQSSEQRREFKASEYLADVLRSLAHEFKRHRVEYALDCEPVVLVSYPGVYAQILTNLCINAMIHAYPDGGGLIRISGRQVGEEFILEVADEGLGMTPAVSWRIFEPFFTTRRGSGGSGLGLHIVYNQVTQQLGGSIRCNSAPQAGTRFEIRVPRISPLPKLRSEPPEA